MIGNHFFGVRVEPGGSPFRCQDLGYNEANDFENQKRFYEASQNYLAKFAEENPDFEIQTSWTRKNAALLYPLFGGSLLYSVSKAYSRPSSFYIRKMALTFGVVTGLFTAKKHYVRDYNLALLKNFHRFDKSFQDALETGDSRYLREFF